MGLCHKNKRDNQWLQWLQWLHHPGTAYALLIRNQDSLHQHKDWQLLWGPYPGTIGCDTKFCVTFPRSSLIHCQITHAGWCYRQHAHQYPGLWQCSSCSFSHNLVLLLHGWSSPHVTADLQVSRLRSSKPRSHSYGCSILDYRSYVTGLQVQPCATYSDKDTSETLEKEKRRTVFCVHNMGVLFLLFWTIKLYLKHVNRMGNLSIIQF